MQIECIVELVKGKRDPKIRKKNNFSLKFPTNSQDWNIILKLV